ncbi:unnamed protein product [Prunus armeniaca]|nr:unnamed protein product [Prunus armeniaca]
MANPATLLFVGVGTYTGFLWLTRMRDRDMMYLNRIAKQLEAERRMMEMQQLSDARLSLRSSSLR